MITNVATILTYPTARYNYVLFILATILNAAFFSIFLPHKLYGTGCQRHQWNVQHEDVPGWCSPLWSVLLEPARTVVFDWILSHFMALDLYTSWICLKLQLLRLYMSVSTVDLFSIAHVLKLENSQPLLSQSVCYMRLFLGNIFCRRPLLCNLECWPLLDSSCRWNQWGQSQHELPLAVSSAYQKSRMHSWNTSQNTVGTNKQSTSIQSKENSLIYAWS